jgi:hypothetical protein
MTVEGRIMVGAFVDTRWSRSLANKAVTERLDLKAAGTEKIVGVP